MTQQKWPPRHCPTAHFTSVLQPQQQMAGACWHLTITILLPFLIDCQILQFTCVHKCHQMSRKCQGLGHEDGPVTWSLCLRGDSCIVKLQRWRQLNSAGCVNKWDHFLRGFLFLFFHFPLFQEVFNWNAKVWMTKEDVDETVRHHSKDQH